MTYEISFGGATAPTTVPSVTATTLPGVTTTAVPATSVAPATSSIVLSRTGTPPAGITDYGVTVECTNVQISGQPFTSAKPSTTFGLTGGTLALNFTLTASSTCSILCFGMLS